MHSTWLSLAWKEWHEHKWKLVSMIAALWGVTSLVILLERGSDRFGVAVGMLFMCGIPMAVFIGLGTAANERSRRTLPFLQSLPVPMWRVAVLKLMFGLITVLAAIAITVASFSLWMWLFEILGVRYHQPFGRQGGPILGTGVWQVDIILFCIPVVGSLFIWTAAAGVNRRDEVAAGVVALAAIVGAWALTIFVEIGLLEASTPRMHMIEAIFYGMAPGSFAIVADNMQLLPYVAIAGLAAAIVHSLLIAHYIRRFGRVADLGTHSPQVARPVSGEWLGAPRSSVLTAIGWKQLRESGAIAIAGLVGILGICTFVYATEHSKIEFASVYGSVAVSLGFGIALVAGIGVALHDSQPSLNTFWRTRPINVDLWFAVKFVTGLAIVLLVIYVPMLLVPRGEQSSVLDPDAGLMLPAMHIAVFAAAVAMTCLVRHAIYAAVLSIGVLTASISAAWLVWDAACRLGFTDLSVEAYDMLTTPAVVLAGASVCFVVSTLLAWLATRYDWGLKSRY